MFLKKGKFITPFNSIPLMKEIEDEKSWAYGRMPEYLWMGLVLKCYGREVGLQKLYVFVDGTNSGNYEKGFAIAEHGIFAFGRCIEWDKFVVFNDTQINEILKGFTFKSKDVIKQFLVYICLSVRTKIMDGNQKEINN